MQWGRAVPPEREPPDRTPQPQGDSSTESTDNSASEQKTVSAGEAFEELLNCVFEQEAWAKQEDHIDQAIQVNFPGE